MSYTEFLAGKRPTIPSSGVNVPVAAVHPSLFPHQKDLVVWALRKGRAAIFADTGLGKTRMQLEWASLLHRTNGTRTLILAPLSIARQTVKEAASISVGVTLARSQAEAMGPAERRWR